MQEIIVLRYGHRIVRDQRVTTHCCLTARAFGAKKIIICGFKDKKIIKTIKKVNSKWREKISVCFTNSWKKSIEKLKKEKHKIVHLTMHGKNIDKKIVEKLKKEKKLTIIIGSKKVEPSVYKVADYNIAIGKQPHSEISALAILLYELTKK